MEEGLALKPLQLEALTKFIAFPRFLNMSGCGVGKTPVSCVYTEFEVNTNGEKVVWIQPTSIIKKNKQELEKWTSIPPEEIVIIEGTKPKKIALCNQLNTKVFLLTADAWASEYGDLIRNNHKPNVIICDEPHTYYRGWDSKRTQKFVRTLKPSTKVKFMTATPTPHGNLFSAYIYAHVLQQSYYKHVRYFKNIHAIYDEFDAISGWENHQVLKDLLDHYSIRHTAKDMYGEQEKYIDRRLLDMKPKQAKVYKEFEELGLLELKEGIVSGEATEGLETLRLRQILNSPHKIKLPATLESQQGDFQEVSVFKEGELTSKDEEILAFLNEGEPLAIFGVFENELNHILEVCTNAGFKGELINGTVSGKRRGEIDEQFRNGELDFVVCSVKTAAVGFNWGHLNTIIFHSMDYGDDDFVQAYSRGLRGVRENPLRIVILEYIETIECVILWKIHNKSKSTNKVNPDSEIIRFPKLEENLDDVLSIFK